MGVLMEFSMFPTSSECREGSGVSSQVSKIIDMIDQSGASYQLTPMGTVVETDTMAEALSILEKSYECLDGCDRVYSSVKFDIRKNKSDRLKQKIASVEKKLGRSVKT